MSYLKSLSWSSVSNGLGNNWKNFADNFPKNKGTGNKILRLSIRLSNFSIISFNVSVSVPTHSIICE